MQLVGAGQGVGDRLGAAEHGVVANIDAEVWGKVFSWPSVSSGFEFQTISVEAGEDR